MPVITHDDLVNAAAQKGDRDPAGAGIKRVFNKFLEGTCRPFDNLPGGDLVNQRIGELPDAGHGG